MSGADLAVAFTLHWVATGKPFAGWYDPTRDPQVVIRAQDGCFYYDGFGLLVIDFADNSSAFAYGMAARIPPSLLEVPPR